MGYNLWEGERVRLRAIEPSDWEWFHHYEQDSEAARLMDRIPIPRSKDESQSWISREMIPQDGFRLAVETLNRELVGSISTHACDKKNGTFQYGIFIFRKHWRKGYASEAIALLLRYYFGELSYQKVTVYVHSFNHGSIRLHTNLGFQLEGRLRRMVYTQGRYYDQLVFGLTKEEFYAGRNQPRD
ncbi:GNAT family N-acetyltransferase [Desmospora profundinema]|uniref:RimJ/RimL family protein N-acetyltransferase n=1 Tax=Desmospora profundinema TaxID=1571184 RepID=A0ABU1IHZ4_9BACL|nr:GNAT family N-acetyltransferase [Desmospora profundinema]MDR6224390.1 RimJ/RimL family protein N-acetyltransferase [Desmospora profundinema]